MTSKRNRSPPVLTTSRLTLRPLLASDLPALAAAFNDVDIAKWFVAVPFTYSMDDAKAFLTYTRTGHERVWVIDDGALAGIGLSDELGFWLARRSWRQGYATEAAHAVLTWHFLQPQACDVVAKPFEGNAPSRRVLEKLGFEDIGDDVSPCRSRGPQVRRHTMHLNPRDGSASTDQGRVEPW